MLFTVRGFIVIITLDRPFVNMVSARGAGSELAEKREALGLRLLLWCEARSSSGDRIYGKIRGCQCFQRLERDSK